jgi:hypothetical protein
VEVVTLRKYERKYERKKERKMSAWNCSFKARVMKRKLTRRSMEEINKLQKNVGC